MNRYVGLKISKLFVLFFVMINSAFSQKAELSPVSKIQNVIVYTNRAMIMKESVCSVKRGDNIIRLTGLTPNLMDQSIQVSIADQSDIRIGEVVVEETYLNQTEQPGLQKLKLQLNTLDDQIKEGFNQIDVIKSSNDFIKRINPFPQNLRVTVADLESHDRYLEKSLTENFGRIAAIESKLKKLGEEQKAVEKEIADFNAGKEQSKSIVIHLLSTVEKSNIKLLFSYVTPEAGWNSLYEARADYSASTIDLNYLASIWQSTGEDWREANVELSTAQPFVYGNTPELSAWYVDVYTPRVYMTKSARVMEVGAVSELSVNDNEFSGVIKNTEIREENTSFSFVLPRKVDVASDGKPHQFTIANAGSPATLSYYTVPKLIQNAFLKASMKNPFKFPLLTGSLSVFLDQKLVGNGSVAEVVLPEGEMNIALGIDEGIKIERKLQKKFTDYSGVFNKETKVNYEYTIEITNGKSKKVTLNLNDQFPISRNEKIRIESTPVKGDEVVVNEEGIISWKVTLAAGEKKSIPIQFSVSYPKELSVTGL